MRTVQGIPSDFMDFTGKVAGVCGLLLVVFFLFYPGKNTFAQSPTCDIPLIMQTFANAGYSQLNVQGQDCSLYFYNNANTSANAAQTAAQALGANLASIQTQAENDALQQGLLDAGFAGAVVWIGGGFAGTGHGPNDFTWYDGSPVNFINWNPGEPNNNSGLPGVQENCMQMVVNSGLWNDLVCGAEPLGLGPMGTSVIEVNLCPEITVTGLGGPVCTGDQLNLSSSAQFGSTPYNFAWFIAPSPIPAAMGNTYTPTVNATTTYVAGVQDVYSCGDTAMFTVTSTVCGDCSEFLPPLVSSTPTTCAGSTGTATATPQGGTAPYTATWNTVPQQNGLTATGLAAGTYTVTVTDASDCEESAEIVLGTDPGSLTVTMTDLVHTSCFGVCDGEVTALPQGGALPYSFAWAHGAITEQIIARCADDYEVTVTDADGCEVTAAVSISEPDTLILNLSVINTSCPGVPNGSASVAPQGGTPPFTTDWGGATPTGLAEGDYSVTVTDANGCSASEDFSVAPGAGLNLQLNVTDNVCFAGSAGQAALVTSNGVMPYDVAWTDAFGNVIQANPGSTGLSTLTGLAAGVYNVSVEDAIGCAGGATVTITQPSQPLVLTLTPQHLRCHEGSDGEVIASQNGLAPFQYAVSDIFGTPAGNAVSNDPHTFTGLSADTYFVTVVDANNCQNTDTVLLNQPSLLEAEGTSTNITCFGANDGTAQITLTTGGTTPYAQTTWEPAGLTGSTAINLPQGNVTATVADANGCVVTLSFLITEPLQMRLLPSYLTDTCGLGKGSATVNTSFGTPPYSYLWDTPNAGSAFTETGLFEGVYMVYVADANGCSDSVEVIVRDDLPYPLAAFTSRIDGEHVFDQEVQFLNNSNGTISYQWNFGDGNTSLEEEPTHRYAAAGDYLVQLLASNGYCADTAYGYVNIDPLLRVYVPNAFTPGINNINDTFYPQGEGIEPDSYVMHIYDRWGKLVWQTGNFESRWDGRHYKSLEPMQTGVYTYHIRFRKLADLDGFKITGAVHLIRD